MFYHDARARDTLVPLLLRLALAGVFIYHGVDKVFGPGNDLGLSWATQYWAGQGKPPANLEWRLRSLPEETQERFRELYSAEGPELPAALQLRPVQAAVAWGELIGGGALLLGLLTRLAATGMVIIQLGALYMYSSVHGFSMSGGADFNVVLAVMCLCLMLIGGGSLSLDYCLGLHGKNPQGASAQPVTTGTGMAR